MVRVRKKEGLNETVSKMVLEAPMIAKKAQPGQFVIVRAKEESERIPLTIADYDRKEGTVTIIYQIVGAGTMELDTVREGEYVQDLVGPLGKASETEGLHKVAVVGGGVGCAIAYPLAKKLHGQGAEVHSVVGFRSRDLVILEEDCHRTAGDDEIRQPFDQEIWDQDGSEHEPHYDRRDRDVRGLPADRRGPDQVCLCGRPGL